MDGVSHANWLFATEAAQIRVVGFPWHGGARRLIECSSNLVRKGRRPFAPQLEARFLIAPRAPVRWMCAELRISAEATPSKVDEPIVGSVCRNLSHGMATDPREFHLSIRALSVRATGLPPNVRYRPGADIATLTM